VRKVFRNRNFSLLFFGNLVSSIGNVFYNFAISWYILNLTGSALQAGTYIATGGLISILIGPFAGVIADRLDKVKIVYLTDYVRGAAVIAAGIAVGASLSTGWTLFVLYLVTVVLSINGALFQPAVLSLQADILPEEDYQSANATINLIRSFEGIIGVLLGGTLYALLGIEWIFIINGATFILSGVSEMFIRFTYEKKANLSWKRGIEDLVSGFKYFLARKGLMQLMIAILLLNFAFVPMFSNVLPYTFNQILQTSPIDFSLVQVSISFGMLTSAIILGNMRRSIPPMHSVYFGMSGIILMYGLMAINLYLIINQSIEYSLFLVVAIGIMFLFGMINIYINTPITTAFMKTIEPAFRGRSNATIGVLAQAAIPFAIFLGGLIIELSSVLVVMVYGSTILVLIWVYLMKSKQVRSYLDRYQ
jgi:MFS transporter, DHA3 family, macrolide efflux protein